LWWARASDNPEGPGKTTALCAKGKVFLGKYFIRNFFGLYGTVLNFPEKTEIFPARGFAVVPLYNRTKLNTTGGRKANILPIPTCHNIHK
jgi:hypothetical protein